MQQDGNSFGWQAGRAGARRDQQGLTVMHQAANRGH